jgi:NO-binding membrane sensor protein with MHYT domain
MKISAELFELVVFVASLAAFVALDVIGRVDPVVSDALFALMGTAVGHGLGRLRGGMDEMTGGAK